MTSRINNIKSNKLVMRDYLGLINEIVYCIESKIENIDNQQEKQELDNKIDQLKSYKIIIKEYMNLNYINHFDDDNLCIIYEDALVYASDEVRSCYPSIFNENIYFDLIKNLKDISNNLLNKTVINVEIYEYIMDYLTNSNSFETWKDMYSKCVYILCDYITKIRNEESPTYYSNIEEFNDSINVEETPINEWPFCTFRDYDDEYIEHLEVLFSYYYDENENNFNQLNLDSDDDNNDNDNDNDNDDDDEQNPLINKYTLIENNEKYDCGICYNDYETDFFKCNRCIFKICPCCYSNYHLKHNVKNCSMCRL